MAMGSHRGLRAVDRVGGEGGPVAHLGQQPDVAVGVEQQGGVLRGPAAGEVPGSDAHGEILTEACVAVVARCPQMSSGVSRARCRRTLTRPMPRSRNRHNRNRSAKQRRRARQQRAGDGRRLVATIRPGESIEHLLADEDHEAMRLALDAEARGDAQAAWEHHMSGLIVEEAMTHHRLLEMARQGDDVPAWMCSRWAVDQALRWMLVAEDPRCDEIVRTIMGGLHFDEVEPLFGDPVAFQEYGTRIASSDWVFQQLAAYEFGGLRDFLEVRAEESLLAKLDEIDEWERAAVTAYRLLVMHGDLLRARRMADDEEVELLNLGAMNDVEDATVIGRVVPISVFPFLMFESRPLPVDRETAEDVAARMAGDDDLGWFWALASAYEQGRLPAGSTCVGGTLWSTDLAPIWDDHEPSEAGRMRKLRAAGLSEHQANGVGVVEVGLIVAEVAGDIGSIASHVTSVLMDSQIHEAVKAHSVKAGHGTHWRILAAGTPSPVRERCLELADLSDELAA